MFCRHVIDPWTNARFAFLFLPGPRRKPSSHAPGSLSLCFPQCLFHLVPSMIINTEQIEQFNLNLEGNKKE